VVIAGRADGVGDWPPRSTARALDVKHRGQPARLTLDEPQLLMEWKPSYQRVSTCRRVLRFCRDELGIGRLVALRLTGAGSVRAVLRMPKLAVHAPGYQSPQQR